MVIHIHTKIIVVWFILNASSRRLWSLRLFPPAPVIPKVAAEDIELGGYQVKAGTKIHLHIVDHRTKKLIGVQMRMSSA